MKLKELLEQYSDVELTEEQVKQVKDYLGIKENKKWKPKNNEKYFYIDCYGEIDYAVFDNNDEADVYGIFINNCFKTKEDAEFGLEQIKVYYELKNFADENNEKSVEEYRFLLNLTNNKLTSSSYTYLHHIGEIGFSSQALAEQAIKKVGADRIKKYLFGVGVDE